MSAIGGFYAPFPSRDGKALLSALADGLAERGPDGCQTIARDLAGMVYRPFHTTPESRFERQPINTEDGVLMTWDGRLDNHDLPAGDGVRRAEALSDAELALAAFRRWGADFADRLTGDFAAAVWEPRPRRLVLARDPFGARPLFYTADARGRLLWASNVTALRRAGGVDTALDESWIAGYFGGLPPDDRTVFKSIRSLPPGHVLTVDEQGRHLRRYWPGRSLREVRCADDREYEENFKALLRDAVRRRLRASGPVFAELSGGVDSSSIVCLADEALRESSTAVDRLQTCSFVFEEARSGDEREFIQRVEELIGRPSHLVSDREAPLLEDFLSTCTEVPSSLSSFRSRYRVVSDHMRAAGARVLLSGIGGDDLGLSEVDVPPHLADLAAAGELRNLLRETRHWSGELEQPWISLAWNGILLPLLPAGLQRRWALPRWQRIPWLRKGFVRRSDFNECLASVLPGEAEQAIRRPSLRQRCAGLRATVVQQVQPRYLDVQVLGREMRFPFLHRPLVEFCLGLPIGQLIRPGETRSIHRRALAEVLPREVAYRSTKSGPDEAMVRAVGREWRCLEKMFSNNAFIYQAGIVERGPFLEALEKFRFGLIPQAGPVFRAIEVEAWLRHIT